MLDRNKIFLLKQTIQDSSAFDKQAELFRCIGDPTCLKLISLLAANKMLCVSDLTKVLGLSMPAVSHQLKKLHGLGLVTRKRDGQIICYSLSQNTFTRKLKGYLKKFT